MDATQPQFLGPGSLITDRLAVVRTLGAGGLGVVYEVEHKFTRHHRAVKVLHPQFRRNADVVERFLREASAAGRIGNPHIVETFDAGYLEDGSPFIVMEYLEGKPLNDVLRWNGHLEPGLACAVLAQVCEAVQAAHEANIVHRDLKPENLFVTQRDGQAFIKVLDFGISKFQSDEAGDQRSTRTGITMGTPMYMPPEQLRSARNADARSDVYSLGVILYELLVGRAPFVADSIPELMVKIMTEDPSSPRTLDAALPQELSAIVLQALSKDPARRFSSAAEMGVQLERFSRNVSIAPLLEHDVLPEDGGARTPSLAGQAADKTRATPMPVQSRGPVRASLSGTAHSRPGVEPPPSRVLSRPPVAASGEPSLVALPPPRRGLALVGVLGLAVVAIAAGWALLRGDGTQPAVTTTPTAVPTASPREAPVPAPSVPLPVEPSPEKVVPPAPPPPVAEEVKPPPAVVVHPAEKVAKKRVDAASASGPRGIVDLDCRDAACTIEIDGRQAGETPRLGLQLEPGAHVAVFTNMETKATATRELNVRVGERLRVAVPW